MEASSLSPQEALQELKTGNDRFMSGTTVHPNCGRERLQSTFSEGQHPFAGVLACADSRVPVELIFDRGVGDVFDVRIAGNILGSCEMGSVEFAIDHLEVPVFVVLGHKKCGAVKAVYENGLLPGHMREISEKILPAVEMARHMAATSHAAEKWSDERIVDEAARINVWNAMEEALVNSAAIRARAASGACMILGAFYCIDTGEIEWMGTHPRQDEILTTA